MSRINELQPAAFQQLVGALAARALGPRVKAFGSGPDGGRDFTFRGELKWQSEGQSEYVWDGYTVFQVKFKEEVGVNKVNDARWVAEQFVDELKRWADPESKRLELPKNLLLVTNVPLTPGAEFGGYDRVHTAVSSVLEALQTSSHPPEAQRARAIENWEVWDGNEINKLTHAYPDVRRSFKGMLTPEDIVAALGDEQRLARTSEDVREVLATDARQRLVRDKYVYLEQSGIEESHRAPLTDIAIDVPVIDAEGSDSLALREMIEAADLTYSPGSPFVEDNHHLVLIAGPGNGKSTLSKMLAQIYRAAFVSGGSKLGRTHRDSITGVDIALDRLGLPQPSNRRWPFRIDLAEYIDRSSDTSDGQTSIFRWIAEQIVALDGNAGITAQEVKQWLADWPWLLILDGLDEVTEESMRQKLVADIESFVAEAESSSADLQVVITTRPMGYEDGEVPEEQFRSLRLGHLPPAQALQFGRQLIGLRIPDDPDRRGMVCARLDTAFQNPALKPLMGTPLQVSIVSFLVESTTSLPVGRLALFRGYYQAVLKREISKGIALSHVLRKYSRHIETLHIEVGYLLQCRSERAGNAVSAIEVAELREILRAILEKAGYTDGASEATDLEEMVNAATSRLVLLAPRDLGAGVGFDLRSFQEMFAALKITRSPASTVDALRVIAVSPHWRNTWLFAANEIFERHELAIPELIDLVIALDRKSPPYRLARIAPAAPALAVDLIDEGVADALPIHLEPLCIEAATALAGVAPVNVVSLTRALVRAASITKSLRRTVSQSLNEAERGGMRAREVTKKVRGLIDMTVREFGASADLVSLGAPSVVPKAVNGIPCHDDDRIDAAAEVKRALEGDSSLPAEQRALLVYVVKLLQSEQVLSEEDRRKIETVTANDDLLHVLEIVLAPSRDVHLIRRVRDSIIREIERQPVGDQLTELLEGPATRSELGQT